MKKMMFITIPAGMFPKTRKQLAKDTGKKSLTNMSLPVYYADENSSITFTDLDILKAWSRLKKVIPFFVEAGRKQ